MSRLRLRTAAVSQGASSLVFPETMSHLLRKRISLPRGRIRRLVTVYAGSWIGGATAGMVLAIAALAPGGELPQAVPVEGEPFGARLVAVDSEWQLTFDGESGRRVMPAAELVRWGRFAEVMRGPVLVLADGGLLTGAVYGVDKERLTAESDLFGPVKLPLEQVAGVVFELPADRHARDLRFDRVGRATGDSDLLILNNGDEVAGRLEHIDDTRIRLAAAVGPVDVEVHRVRALVFNPALLARREPRGLRAMAGFADGSRLVADRLELSGQSLRIDVAGAQRWTTAAEDLIGLQPRGGRVTYLSDLPVADDRHVPFLDLPWPYQTDRSVSGAWLRAGGRLYLKGLGVHSAARLTYLLDEPYRRFEAELAVDDETAGQGSVRFRVFVDGRVKHTSPTVRGREPPVPISVHLSDAKRLDLVVDFADRADVEDHADWLDARLVP